MDGLWQVRGHIPQHHALDGADIGNNRALLEMRRNFLRDRPAGADRDGQDHKVRVLHGVLVCLDHAIDDAEFLHARTGCGRARGGHDLSGKSLGARRARDRAADQAEADQCDTLE